LLVTKKLLTFKVLFNQTLLAMAEQERNEEYLRLYRYYDEMTTNELVRIYLNDELPNENQWLALVDVLTLRKVDLEELVKNEGMK